MLDVGLRDIEGGGVLPHVAEVDDLQLVGDGRWLLELQGRILLALEKCHLMGARALVAYRQVK